MAVYKYRFLFLLMTGLLLITSCKPINIFSPLVDPSRMGEEAMLDAGYNALAEGNYNQAIDYFSNVILSAQGDMLTEAYVGRGAAYLHSSSDNVNAVTEGVINGSLDISKPGELIRVMVTDGNYVSFFSTMKLAAADYASAMSLQGSSMEASRLQDTYQTNMMAAAGVGAARVAADYLTTPWIVPGEVTLNTAIDEILKDGTTSGHPYHTDTWEYNDPTYPGGTNGLYEYVRVNAGSKSEMMVYLTNAYNACTHMQTNLPVGFEYQDIQDMKNGIRKWSDWGLADSSLGAATP
jgi:hypothetical protein